MFATVTPARTVRVHEKELLTSVEGATDHVTPQELAAWIVEGRSDYRLIDLRDAKAYAAYHIPTAENVPLATLADGAPRPHREARPLLRRRHPRRAGVDGPQGPGLHVACYTLLEGLDAWKDEVLFPVQPRNATAEDQARFERAAQVARFFGGQPRAASAPGSEPGADDDAGRAGDAVRGTADAAGRRRRHGPPEEEGRLLSRSVAQVTRAPSLLVTPDGGAATSATAFAPAAARSTVHGVSQR